MMNKLYNLLDNKPQLNRITPLNFNIQSKTRQNIFEEINNNYNNSHLPNFKYYNDDKNLNLTPIYNPQKIYKTKNIFNSPGLYQTEQNEQGMNTAFLDNYFGYRDLGGSYLSSYQDLNKIKKNIIKTELF